MISTQVRGPYRAKSVNENLSISAQTPRSDRRLPSRKTIKPILGPALWTFSLACAAQTCADAEKQLHPGEPCIPSVLFNYLYCLEHSGGDRIEIADRDVTGNEKKVEILLNGKGSGVIVQAQGGATYSSTESQIAVKEIQEKLDPTLAAKCQAIAETIRHATSFTISNSITALGAIPAEGWMFDVTALSSYSGDHGPLITLQVCAGQDDNEVCRTSAIIPLAVSNKNTTRLLVPATSATNSLAAAMAFDKIDLRREVRFRACMVTIGMPSDRPGRALEVKSAVFGSAYDSAQASVRDGACAPRWIYQLVQSGPRRELESIL